jgi:hypothetical protein
LFENELLELNSSQGLPKKHKVFKK